MPLGAVSQTVLLIHHFFVSFPPHVLQTQKKQVDCIKEVQKTRLEVENVRRQMLQQEIHFNIQQTEALTRYL